MLKKILKKENSIKIETNKSDNIVLNKALEMLADNILEEMIKCKIKTAMSELSHNREILVNLSEYVQNNEKKFFECKKEYLNLIIKSLNDYKELISIKIKKSTEDIDFDLLCEEIHICNKLYKCFYSEDIIAADKNIEEATEIL